MAAHFSPTLHLLDLSGAARPRGASVQSDARTHAHADERAPSMRRRRQCAYACGGTVHKVAVEVQTIRDLLRPLSRPAEEFVYLWVSVDEDVDGSFAQPLHRLLSSADFAERLPSPHRPEPSRLPTTIDDLVAVLKPVALPADRLLGLLTSTCTQDLAYRSLFGPWDAETARSVLHQVMGALGPDSCWWSNNNFSYTETWSADGSPAAYASNPVTGHCFNRALVGSGNGIVVTFLAVAND